MIVNFIKTFEHMPKQKGSGVIYFKNVQEVETRARKGKLAMYELYIDNDWYYIETAASMYVADENSNYTKESKIFKGSTSELMKKLKKVLKLEEVSHNHLRDIPIGQEK